MNIQHKIYHLGRLILSAFLLFAVAACGTKPQESAAHVTSTGFVCPEPSPRVEFESKEINIFTWTEYVPADIIDCFGLVYGVDVNVDYFSSNEELYTKMSFGESVNPYDVVHPSDYMIDVLIREGLLQKLDSGKLENMKNLDGGLISAYGSTLDFIVPYQMGTQAIVYNSETVTNPPTSWADLWSPEYKGRIVAVDDNRVVIGMALLTLGYDVNTTDEAQLEEAKQKLIELMPNIRVFDSDSPKTPLVAGDVDLGIVWNGEAFLAKQENAAFEYAFPKEGSIIFFDGMGIPTNAPHPDISYAWFNYMMQGDVFWLTLVDYPYTIPNQAALDFAKANHAEVYEAYMASPITNTPADIFAQGHKVEDLGNALSLYDQIWTEIKE
ncbi:MAG: spermidine/putrescine ABC transporter substrate-binding protein [Anaerolineales bacterium]|uniref:ABC transporter substrate-binding protein n=1 Tax=Candidatus Villigracilis affinis TaxID=3140682 RepID=UPI001D617CAB|nr:spermidine/putrescine ABC transporter substrate-binding protein [Anaerolineales bacterium]MBK9600626.1 spermidine/putrescine ABC transporter substrate-binding protein [Anaerolineales bacterium]